MKNKIIYLFFIIFLISTVQAFNYSSGTYTSTLATIDSGGTNTTSGTYTAINALSQVAYFNITSGTFTTQLGALSSPSQNVSINLEDFEEIVITPTIKGTQQQDVAIPGKDPEQICNEQGFIWYNQTCWECKGDLTLINGTIVCFVAPPDVDTFIGMAFGNQLVGFLLIITFISLYIIDSRQKKKKKNIKGKSLE